tara:strand:+ start:282 stop:497 length:216 start_codon:yes stop_codon:yes gene_type:complete
MDIAIQWGALYYFRKEINANPFIIIIAIFLDAIVLVMFLWVKYQADPLVIWASVTGLILIFLGEKIFLKLR